MLVSGARYVPNENARTMKWRVCERVDKMSIASFCRVRAFYYIPYLNDIEGMSGNNGIPSWQGVRTIVAGRSYHRGGTFVPSWWYVCTIVVVRLYHRGGTTFISWVHVFYRADTRL